MIANNFRRYPDAMARQLVLPFGHKLVWALPRPGSRVLRAIRAARAAAFKAAGRVRYPVKPVTPQWWIDAKRRARKLADAVRDLQLSISERHADAAKGYKAHVEKMRAQTTEKRLAAALACLNSTGVERLH